MRIKLAILEKDSSYLNRIVATLNTKYADKFEIYSFTNPEVCLATIVDRRIDVLVASDVFDINIDELPARCGFAYFVERVGIDQTKGEQAICKFQKLELIYKQILSIYSEKAGSISGLKLEEGDCKVIGFTSVSGGVGSSSMAAACAMHYAKQGAKTLYLNFERFGSSDAFFKAEGLFDMSDVIFALKTKKANIPMKLQSCIRQDSSGVYFYATAKSALDMMEIKLEEFRRFMDEVKISDSYEYIILDVDFGMGTFSRETLKEAHSVVWVGDGSEISNLKTTNAYNALSILERNEEHSLTNKIILAYNKFSNKTGMTIEIDNVKNIGGAPRYEHASTTQVISELSKLSIYDQID